MVHITHNKHRLLELTIHIICWGLFFGFPLFFTQDDSGSIDWREFINHSGVSLSFFVIFYINYLLFIPKVLFKEHTGQFILLNILLILVVSIGLRYWHNIIASLPRLHDVLIYLLNTYLYKGHHEHDLYRRIKCSHPYESTLECHGTGTP